MKSEITATGAESPRRNATRYWRGALILLGLVFTFAMAAYCCVRHQHLHSFTWDLAQEMQVIWNSAQGRWFESSIEVQNNLGDHTTFMHVIFIAAYALVPAVETVLILQAVMFSLGAVFVWKIALRTLESPRLAFAAGAAYLLQPAAGHALGYDFHLHCLMPLFTLMSFHGVLRQRWWQAWLGFALLVLTREDAGITAAALGLLVLAYTPHRKTGIAMTGGGVLASFLLLAVVLPFFRLGEGSDTLARYAQFGDSPSEIIINLITRPQLAWLHLWEDTRRIWFLPILALPWLLLPLANWRSWIPLLLVLAPCLLSTWDTQYTIGWQYPLAVVPILAITALLNLQRLRQRYPRLESARAITWLGLAWMGCLLFTNWRKCVFLEFNRIATQEHLAAFQRIRSEIPPDASLSVTSRLGPQFYRRRCLRDYPDLDWDPEKFPDLPTHHCEFVLLDTSDEKFHYWLEDSGQPIDPAGYDLIRQEGPFRLYRHE